MNVRRIGSHVEDSTPVGNQHAVVRLADLPRLWVELDDFRPELLRECNATLNALARVSLVVVFAVWQGHAAVSLRVDMQARAATRSLSTGRPAVVTGIRASRVMPSGGAAVR